MQRIGQILKRFFITGLVRLRFPLTARVAVGEKELAFPHASDSAITEALLVSGVNGYEPELVRLVLKYPFPMKTFLDVGANIGFYAALAETSFGPGVSVAAVEPFPNNIAYMEELKKQNSLSFTVYPFAIGEKSGETLPLYVPEDHRSSKFSTSASLRNRFTGSSAVYQGAYKTMEVKTISLGDLLEKQDGPFLIKLDIEGYELTALRSIESLLRAKDDMDFVIEIMINDEDKQDVFDFMSSCGFSGYLITNAGLVREDRPLTLPYYNQNAAQKRTCWKNHYFTKRQMSEIEQFSKSAYGYWV
jgi:FkbM family methyltransferase